jgi:hypothetical protein
VFWALYFLVAGDGTQGLGMQGKHGTSDLHLQALCWVLMCALSFKLTPASKCRGGRGECEKV